MSRAVRLLVGSSTIALIVFFARFWLNPVEHSRVAAGGDYDLPDDILDRAVECRPRFINVPLGSNSSTPTSYPEIVAIPMVSTGPNALFQPRSFDFQDEENLPVATVTAV